MHDILVRIKRAALQGRCRFTEKAIIEMRLDSLTREDVIESIVNARSLYKSIRSTRPTQPRRREYLHIIRGYTLGGILIYSKGKLAGPPDEETFFLLISAKRDIQ
jgi:hypothetical protein